MTDYIIGGEILTKRKLVTIDGSMVTTETGIPLALNIVLPNVKAAGADVRLAELDGTPIAREIECINVPSTDAVMLHYSFDTTTDENSQFYIYWGNASLNEPAVDSTYGSETVWSDYEAVWLMNENPTGITTDRTGNGHDGTGYGFISGDLINSTYGKQINFDGTDAHIDMNRVTELEGVSETWTIGISAAFDIAAANNILFGYDADGACGVGDIYAHYASATSTIKFGVGAGEVDTTISDVSDTEMHLMIFRHTTTNALAYEDGVNKYDAAKDGTAASASHTFKLGENYNVAYLNGKIGFAYIHPDSLSGNYIITQHKNQNNPTATGTDPFYLNRYDDSQTYNAELDSSGTKSTFLRRTPITRNHTGALTDYQQKYTIPYHVLMNTDFSDLRFNTQADGNGTYLEYWIELKTDSDTADIWVKSDYASGDDIIYMFYGNDLLTSESNGSNTFIQWHGAATADFIDSLVVDPATFVYESKIKQDTATSRTSLGISNLLDLSDDAFWIRLYPSSPDVKYAHTKKDGVASTISETYTQDTNYHKYKITHDGTTVRGYDDDDEISTGITANIPTEIMGLVFRESVNASTQAWAFVRKYTATEPTYTIGVTDAPDKFSAVSDSDGNISTFERRKPVKLTHSGALTNYQYYETFDYEPAMLDNFDDIRFVTQSGEHIPYWIETKTDGISAKIWFVNDYVDGDTYIWMYYGSEGLSTGSSGSSVFLQWHGSETTSFVDSYDVTPTNIIYESKVRRTSGAGSYVRWGLKNTAGTTLTDDAIIIQIYEPADKRHLNTYNEGSGSAIFETPVLVQDQWYIGKFTIIGSTMRGYFDNNEIASGKVDYLPDEDMGLTMIIEAGTAEQEYSYVRKYTAVEPTVTVGAEQHLRIGNIMIL